MQSEGQTYSEGTVKIRPSNEAYAEPPLAKEGRRRETFEYQTTRRGQYTIEKTYNTYDGQPVVLIYQHQVDNNGYVLGHKRVILNIPVDCFPNFARAVSEMDIVTSS